MCIEARAIHSMLAITTLLAIPLSHGCSLMIPKHCKQDWNRGYTLVLPGIDCRHIMHRRLARGIEDGGVAGTIEIHDWTTGIPPLMLLHLRNAFEHDKQAEVIAQKIVAYQTSYPGRPVHLIGHSGGAGIALMALDRLPMENQVNSLVLLHPAVSPAYDLRKALQQSRAGVWNFSSAINDSALLVLGTTLFGTVDGYHRPAAGALGFNLPEGLSYADRWNYHNRLHEVPYRLEFLSNTNLGGHYGAMTYSFSKTHIAPILVEAGKR